MPGTQFVITKELTTSILRYYFKTLSQPNWDMCFMIHLVVSFPALCSKQRASVPDYPLPCEHILDKPPCSQAPCPRRDPSVACFLTCLFGLVKFHFTFLKALRLTHSLCPSLNSTNAEFILPLNNTLHSFPLSVARFELLPQQKMYSVIIILLC